MYSKVLLRYSIDLIFLNNEESPLSGSQKRTNVIPPREICEIRKCEIIKCNFALCIRK